MNTMASPAEAAPDMSFNSSGETVSSIGTRINGIISMLESPLAKKEVLYPTNDQLAATQPVEILKDVVALVEVRTGAENRTKAIISKLKQLGASVVEKLNDSVTHVIWKDGKKSTVDRAKKRGIPVVTVLWVDSCMQNEARVSENLFAVHHGQEKGTPLPLPRLKKAKSMQPKEFDEDVASSAERGERIRKRKANREKRKPKSPLPFFVADTQPRSPVFGSPFLPGLVVPESPASLKERYNCIKRNLRALEEEDIECPESPVAGSSCVQKTVQKKLFDRSSVSSPPSSPKPLSTSTQNSPTQRRRSRSKGAEEDEDADNGMKTPVSNKDNSPPPRPLSPVINTVDTPAWTTDSPAQITTPSRRPSAKDQTEAGSSADGDAANHSSVLPRKSPRLKTASALAQQGKRLKEQKTQSETEAGKSVRPLAKPRMKKLLSNTSELNEKLLSPMAFTASSSVAEESVLGITGIKVPKAPSKNNTSVLSTLIRLPKPNNKRKRKRTKTSEDEDEAGKMRKRSKLENEISNESKSTEDKKQPQEDEASAVSKKSHPKGSRRGKSPKETPVDVLQVDFESTYEETLYVTSQANKSKIWATVNPNTQPNVAVRKSRRLSAAAIPGSEEAKTETATNTAGPSTSHTEVNASSGPGALVPTRTSRRRSIATASPTVASIPEKPVSGEQVRIERKGRRKSIAVSSPTAADVKGGSSSGGNDHEAGKQGKQRAGATAGRPKQVAIVSPEDQSRRRSSRRRSSTQVRADQNFVMDTPDVNRHAPANPKPEETQSANNSFATPITASNVHTPSSRRRSMRIIAITNSMQKSGTPSGLRKVPENDLSQSAVEVAREKDMTIQNEISVAPPPNKCPADFDSTAEESLLAVAKRKKKKGTTGSQSSVSGRNQVVADSMMTSDSGVSSTASSSTVLSNLMKSRRSIDEFKPNVSTFSTQRKKKLKVKKSKLSDINSSEEENEHQSSSKPIPKKVKCEKKAAPTKSDEINEISLSRAANDVSSASVSKTIKTEGKPLKLRRNSSKSGKDSSTCSSASDTSGPSRRKYKHSIVLTSLHSEEQSTIKSVVKQMRGFRVKENVDDSTTHVVCGASRRTLNVLYAITRGCWLVSQEWVLNSLEAGEWIEEEPFEVHDFFPACQIARLERATSSGVYKQDLFSTCGLIYVCESTSPPCRHLMDLIELCNGQVTKCPRKAALVVGGVKPSLTCVSEQWVLDSITAHRSLPFGSYSLDSKGKLIRSPSPDY